ncbi:hypothetical protein L579_1225 [Pantoea sp. AS-PWVM4]|uniref:Uncharacterized protein n=1 Tax=Pantoea phytobeneficialis TaxID=2052056 RepID=A0AAP9HAH7_9GAMM|nr:MULTISPECIES: hypothetical protein [Pantoea]ERK09442.1 hypothetical protein L579_1225 [Pantoea sp. AS-PWVM4]MDO6407425.1 hypothetical protein [Pantoea phytobeneficialis]QGR09529.1 hypothetical protein CTZ24_23975 [Pantoea phytobeneficialis]
MHKSTFYYLDNQILHSKECPYVHKGISLFLGSAYSNAQAMSIAKQRSKNVRYCKECCTGDWLRSLDVEAK